MFYHPHRSSTEGPQKFPTEDPHRSFIEGPQKFPTEDPHRENGCINKEGQEYQGNYQKYQEESGLKNRSFPQKEKRWSDVRMKERNMSNPWNCLRRL